MCVCVCVSVCVCVCVCVCVMTTTGHLKLEKRLISNLTSRCANIVSLKPNISKHLLGTGHFMNIRFIPILLTNEIVTNMNTQTQTYIYMFLHVCVWICVCVFVYGYVCVCLCMSV